MSETTLMDLLKEHLEPKEREPKKFYVVWAPERGGPTKRHATYNEARREAERLAKKHLTTTFYILCAYSTVRAPIPVPQHSVLL